MAYKTITVDGKEYQYVRGESYVKVKGLGVVNQDDLIQEPRPINESVRYAMPREIAQWIRSKTNASATGSGS